ncbi:MAG: glycoside hydrolase family 9 protein [Bacteroidota bacterium]
MDRMRISSGFLALSLALVVPLYAQSGEDAIRVNQLGYYPEAVKKAVVVEAEAGPFYVLNWARTDTLLEGTLEASRRWQHSGENVRLADFSGLDAEGTYVLDVPGVGQSYPFEVGGAVHREMIRGTLKALYFARASTAIPEAHGGPWARAAGHPDTEVLVHNSASNPARPAGTIIASPGGWYDAGDYNKYVVPAAASIGNLLNAYEAYPDYFAVMQTGIPTSGDGVPDVIDEVVFKLRWMLTMQDPTDGGVYHKLTTENFQATVMPNQPTAPRYVVAKSTSATLDFAAALAQSARILSDFESVWSGLADSCLTAAVDAWTWALDNRNRSYNQGALSNPSINTGTYGDGNFGDEWQWAGIELYLATADDDYLDSITVPRSGEAASAVWANVESLGYFSALTVEAPTSALDAIRPDVERRVMNTANAYRTAYQQSPYATAVGRRSGDFHWGGNGHAAAIGTILLKAYDLTDDTSYLEAALGTLDYLMGRNASGYAWVTGYGDNPPMHIHHRPSEADNVDAPVPGWLAGGPHANNPDGCTNYPSSFPAANYLDHYCSYSTNEMTTYWNAPLTYLAIGVEQALGEAFTADGAPQPLLVSPANNAENQGRRTPLSWAVLAPTDSFEVQVAYDPDFTRLFHREVTDDADVRLTNWERGTTYYWRVRGFSNGATGGWSTPFRLSIFGTSNTSVDDANETPGSLKVHHIYPNPVRDQVTVAYEVEEPGPVLITLYDVLGRAVRVADEGFKPAGRHEWSSLLDHMAPGTYHIRLRSASSVVSRAVVWL